ncbi:MAG: acyltransferase family protein [Patescibacteria group bacterium]
MKRDETIDTLRGLAMLAMIILHAASYYFGSRTTYLIWDNLQWAVPVFLFCSMTLFYEKHKEFPVKNWAGYLKKRFTRLLVPYYIFLFAYFPLVYFFNNRNFNLQYLAANLFLYKGLDFNWLVLLFIYLTFLMPVVLILRLKNKPVFYGYFVLSLISSVYFIFSPINYRAVMWLPWSIYIYFTIFFLKYRHNKKFLFRTAFIAGMTFFALRFFEMKTGHNLSQFANKYPPTLYHLSFGAFWIIILQWLTEKRVFDFEWFKKIIHFLSVNSYSLFFIHVLVMFTIDWLHIRPPNWPLFFVEVIFASSGIQLALNSFGRLLKTIL